MNSLSIGIFLPIFLGFVLTLQSGMNELIQSKFGLTYTLFINNIVVFTIAITLVILAYHGALNSFSGFKLPSKVNLRLWYLIPGFLGAMIVLGYALSFTYLGAAKTVVFVVLAQLVSSIVWDYYVKNISLDNYRVLGILLTGLGCFIYFKTKK